MVNGVEPHLSAGRRVLTFAHSPDADDAFMFYGFACGAIAIPGYSIQPFHEDIERLNARALQGEFEITAVSAHAYAYVSQRYWVLSCGASVGRGYGPILIRKKQNTANRGGTWRVAIPGKWTTASLVFDLWLAENKELIPDKVVIPFEEILPAVVRGEVDAGLIIHEGQLTYQAHGLEKMWDAGAWWQAKTGLPLPLGLDVVRSDIGLELAKEIDTAFRKSILYAQEHSNDAVQYALQFGRRVDLTLGKKFIGMYVNDDTLTQGREVREGLKQLFTRAYAAGLIPHKPDLTFM